MISYVNGNLVIPANPVFIAVEGERGLGKTTMIEDLINVMQPVLTYTRDAFYLGRDANKDSATIREYVRARSCNERFIYRMLADGHSVISDRYVLSTLIQYKRGLGLDDNLTDTLWGHFEDVLKPNLTIILSASCRGDGDQGALFDDYTYCLHSADFLSGTELYDFDIGTLYSTGLFMHPYTDCETPEAKFEYLSIVKEHIYKEMMRYG